MRILPQLEQKNDGQSVDFVANAENSRFVPKRLERSPILNKRLSNSQDRSKELATQPT